VDFGASDAPLTPEDLAGSQLLQFPVVVGGVVPVINISGIKPGELKLTGRLLADIYLGRIKKWNDAAIGALNPGLTLPNTNITVVHRSEPSGTSLLWTDYASSPPTAAKTTEVLRFFDWALHQGEALAGELDYAPVPRTVIEELPALWGALRDSSGQRLWPEDR